MDQQQADDEDDLFGDEDAPVMVKSASESSEENLIGNELADEVGVEQIVADEGAEPVGTINVDFALLKPVFVNRKDREVLAVNQET